MSPSTNDVPRLISVVEIIKREFKDAPLHQYNEIGCLDEPNSSGAAVIPSEPGEERQAALQNVLQGKDHIPIKRTPYMKITLSQALLPELSTAGTTYQSPIPKKVSRGAKSRKRRRAKQKDNTSGENAGEGDEDAMEARNQKSAANSSGSSSNSSSKAKTAAQQQPVETSNSHYPDPNAWLPPTLASLRRDWRWAAVSQFLYTFQGPLRIDPYVEV
ncbi:hypothetical protein FRC09_000552, partial [Ceratobasidium sp. 395]